MAAAAAARGSWHSRGPVRDQGKQHTHTVLVHDNILYSAATVAERHLLKAYTPNAGTPRAARTLRTADPSPPEPKRLCKQGARESFSRWKDDGEQGGSRVRPPPLRRHFCWLLITARHYVLIETKLNRRDYRRRAFTALRGGWKLADAVKSAALH